MPNNNNLSTQAIDVYIKIAAISLLIYWCYSILQPFFLMVVWGAIIATALYPIATWANSKFGISKSKASSALSVIGVLLLLVPLIALSTGIYTGGSALVTGVQDGTIMIPTPNISIKDWPIIGDKVYGFALQASSNLESMLANYSDEVKSTITKMASFLGSLGGSFIQFIISTVIAGAFMVNADKCEQAFVLIASRLTGGKQGKELTTISKTTVRGVVQGVIGVAVIQSIMAGLGIAIAGIPGVALWMFLILIVAIIQLPPILALLPAIIYAFTVDTTTTAVLFLVWCILVSASDAVLKPMLLGRGSDTPVLVILLGALGGMVMSGIIGLFVGAVVLSLTYQLLTVWLVNEAEEKEKEKSQ